MNRTTDLCLTALAPIIWGSSYIVTTEMLPDGFPLTVALLRALPAGLILLLVVRQLPPAGWRTRVFILGALNFAVFWSMLFVAAYRLPGGVAATLGAIQPLLVLFFGPLRPWIGHYDSGCYCGNFGIDRGRDACAWPDKQP
jgi:probable blue pigment (indigoidine) exporter